MDEYLQSLMSRSDEIWEDSILPSLSEFIEIKALSPLFEPKWAELGELDKTIELFCNWLDNQEISGMKYETHRIDGKSPVLLVTIDGTGPGTHLRQLGGIHGYTAEEQLMMDMGDTFAQLQSDCYRRRELLIQGVHS